MADGAGTRFRVGDAVTLSGFSDARNNGTYILRGIDGAKLIFDPDTFVRAGAVSGVTITRRLPDAQHACSYGNRLWACAHDTVWCTKLGDPLNWFWYEADENGAVATAAWSVDVGAPGDFSGCAATGSGVVFLKPEGLWRLYGTRPDNFQLVASAALGAEQGSGRTLVTAAETLYYLSPVGPARTAGGRPTRIGDALGRTLSDGAAGTDGTRWYLSARDEKSAWHLFVYDTRSGLWSREDDFPRAPLPGAAARSTHRTRGASGASARAARRRCRACSRRATSSAAARTASACCACSCGWRRRGRKHHGGGAV